MELRLQKKNFLLGRSKFFPIHAYYNADNFNLIIKAQFSFHTQRIPPCAKALLCTHNFDMCNNLMRTCANKLYSHVHSH